MRKTLPALALALGACAAPAWAGLFPHVLTASGTVTVKPDDDFLVALPANPTTGYSWAATVSNAKVVTADGAAYRAPASKAMGAGGEQVLAFEAQHPGTATITLSYRRPWEKSTPAAQTVTIVVRVSK